MLRNIGLKVTFGLLLFVFLWIIFLTVRKIVLVRAEKNISQSMQKANYCSADADCALVTYSCPFGCGSYIHKKEVARISKMVLGYFILKPQRCVNSCAMPISPVCRQGKCVPKSCEVDKEYGSSFSDNCRCPQGSRAVVGPQSFGSRSFQCVRE